LVARVVDRVALAPRPCVCIYMFGMHVIGCSVRDRRGLICKYELGLDLGVALLICNVLYQVGQYVGSIEYRMGN
jgi:hypothetical protein